MKHNSVSLTVTEVVARGRISILKHTDDGETKIETPKAGAEFELYLKSSGSYAATKETKWDHLICDENGYAQTKDLSYSTYTLVEIQVPNDYVLDSTKMCIVRSFPMQSYSFWIQRASDGVTGFAAGEYMLKEIAASEGYVIATNIAFTVDSHGQVIIEDTEVVTVTEEGMPYLVMVDGTVTEVVMYDTPTPTTTVQSCSSATAVGIRRHMYC